MNKGIVELIHSILIIINVMGAIIFCRSMVSEDGSNPFETLWNLFGATVTISAIVFFIAAI